MIRTWAWAVFGLIAVLPAVTEPKTVRFPIQSDQRKELTREYARLHYGLDTWQLAEPQMIVVHFTATDSLTVSLNTFRPAQLSGRPDIASGGALNVGIHAVVAQDGTVYTLLPEDAMARHTVGFNHRALGIELVGATAQGLTDAQLTSTAWLVSGMVQRHPTIRYLIGHHEYLDATKPHFALFEDRQTGYQPPSKVDPGFRFMARLRAILLEDGLVLAD